MVEAADSLALVTDAASSSETFVHFYQTKRRHVHCGGTENPSSFGDSGGECSTPLDLWAGDKYGAEITALPVHHMVFAVRLPVNERGFPPQPGAVSRLHKQDQIFPGNATFTSSLQKGAAAWR